MSNIPNCRQCAVCAKFIPDTAPGPDFGPAYCDDHRPKRFLYYTERQIEVIAADEEAANKLVQAELHRGETIDGFEGPFPCDEGAKE